MRKKRIADGYEFSTAVNVLVMVTFRHTCRVDAPCHFDASEDALSMADMPLENFFTEAVCLDLSHKPLQSDISIEDTAGGEKVAGVEIKPKARFFFIWTQ